MARTALIDYVIKHPYVLLHTDFLREIWMIPDRIVADTAQSADQKITFSTRSPMYKGKLIIRDGLFVAVMDYTRIDDRSSDVKTYQATYETTGIVVPKTNDHPLSTPQDSFLLEAGEIENYPEGPPLDTTLGRYTANYQFFVYPFGKEIPYLNSEFDSGKIEKTLANLLVYDKVSTNDAKNKFINALYTFGQNTEIFCPNISEKTIVIPEEIHQLRERLVKENQAALEAGDASAMSDIETQLIKAYKKHLEQDPSMHYLLKSKYFNVTLKKLFLTQGMTELFGEPGKFTFIANPMGNGWKQKDLPYIFDEVRQGSYARAVETANGGVIAKLILRVLQDTRLDQEDCGTTRGEHIHASLGQLKDFKWNYVVNPDGSTTLLDDDTMAQYADKDITIRTPGYCQSTLGFCSKCFGKTFEVLKQKAFAPVANDFARNQTVASLKSMHGKSHSVVDVSDLNRYLV